jgi:hypothetical protein
VKNSAWFAPVIGLVAGLSLARGDTVKTGDPWNPWWLRVVTQAPVTLPPSEVFLAPPSDPAGYPRSGVLPAPPAAPVALPSSGVLEALLEWRTIKAISVNLAPSPRGAATTTIRTEHLPRKVGGGAESRRREHLAHSAASAGGTTAREMKKARIFAAAGDRQTTVLHSRW